MSASPSRPDKADPTSLSFATQAVHVGNHIDEGTGAIRTPLVLANSYALPYDPSSLDWSATTVPLYTRNNGVNQLALEEKLATLEGGEAAVALASGVAALHAAFFTFLRSGDHVVVGDIMYEATWRLLNELLPQRYDITATFVDTSDLDAVRAAVRPTTRMVVAEPIANPTTRVADVGALAEIAHAAGALLVVDSTFTPPPLYRPLTDGADLVVHSLTKYINGHGDAMGGAVIGRAELVERIKSDAMVDVGGIISPFNAWLIQRGSVTLPLRLRQSLRNAEAVAELLEADERVAFVAYPGLPSHPQHEVARRQFGGRGFGATLSFAVVGDAAAQNRFVAALRVITSAVSLGHDESLIFHIGPAIERAAWFPEQFTRHGQLRLALGIEDTADLLADLEAALNAAVG